MKFRFLIFIYRGRLKNQFDDSLYICQVVPQTSHIAECIVGFSLHLADSASAEWSEKG